MRARYYYYRDTAGVTLLTLAVVTAYSLWGAHVLKAESSVGAVSQAVAVES